MKKLCIYHGNCADGFGAAWAVRQFDKDIEFYPGFYQQDPPDVTGRDVIMVDFSYKRDVLLAMAAVANSILILDHHKSAKADLVDLPGNVTAIFDMNRSGAMMAWDYFFPEQEPPGLIAHIQDRDLWRFELKGTAEIQAAIFSYPYDFEVWDRLVNTPLATLMQEGKAILRKHMKDVRELISVAAYRTVICGHNVPVMNAPYFYSSEAGHILCENEPFAACYYETRKGRTYSLRSNLESGGIDVSDVATCFGGGGHAEAAGFSISFEELDKLPNPE